MRAMKAIVFAGMAFLAAAWALGEVPPVVVEDVKVQTIGEERFKEELPAGLVFIAEDGEMYFADEEHPHGRAVCVAHALPDWHSFTNTVRLNGNKLELNGSWGVQGISSTLAVTFGTNVVLDILGMDGGEMANISVTNYNGTTMTLTADCAAEGATIQVCTNLMEAGQWHEATNAVVTASNAVSTTWTVTLLGTTTEFYRVLSAVTREAGIHTEVPIHANEGIEMGGVLATNWGDVTAGCATTGSVAEVAAGVSNHVAATNNPHGVTAAQVGALPLSGGTLTNDLTLDNGTTGDSPCLIFNRGEAGDDFNDWAIFDSSGDLKFRCRRQQSGGAWENVAYISSSGEVSAGGFNGYGGKIYVNNTNLLTWLPSLDGRATALESKVGAWTNETWTFTLTNGTSVSKSVVVEVAP